MAQSLLTITTEAPRETVSIDGVEYPLADREGFSITEQHRMKVDGSRIQALFGSESVLSELEYAELEALVEKQFRRAAPGVPDDVVRKLSHGSKLTLITSFFGKAAREQQSESETSPPPSPVSKDSTEAIRSDG